MNPNPFEQAIYYVAVHSELLDAWYCEVVGENGDLIHCTTTHDTEAKAIVAAQRWVATASQSLTRIMHTRDRKECENACKVMGPPNFRTSVTNEPPQQTAPPQISRSDSAWWTVPRKLQIHARAAT
jgi:hypothetical protein